MSFEWKFATFSAFSFLVLQKYFLGYFDAFRDLMASIIITLLFYLCLAIVFTNSLMYFFSHGDSSWKNVSLEKGFSLCFSSTSTKSNFKWIDFPINYAKKNLSSFSNSCPWYVICIFIHPYWHMISEKKSCNGWSWFIFCSLQIFS